MDGKRVPGKLYYGKPALSTSNAASYAMLLQLQCRLTILLDVQLVLSA